MRKTYQELEFKDAFMFAAVMSDTESCRGVLERILGIPIRKVMVHAEHVLFVNPEIRGVRLDVYADDEHGTVYNVEMQTTDNKNLPKRSRYYQGQMDMAALKTGEDFASLPQSIVIFICTFDPFGRERYRYTFVETCREDGELLEDGTCKIFLNTKGKIETGIGQELVRFLKWIGEPDSGKEKEENDLLITKLRTQITDLKKNRGMEENYMLFGEMLDEERRQGQEEGLKQGLQQGKMDILLKLLQEHKIDVRTAATIMGMNEDEFAKAVKECQEV